MSDDMIQPNRSDPSDISNRRPRYSEDRPRRGDGDDRDDLPRLGSLAQTARNKQLRQARNTLLIVGILMALIQIGMYFHERGQLQDEIQKYNQPGFIVDAAKVKQAEMLLMLIHFSAIAVAVLFIVLSFFVEQYPVPIAALALSIFVGMQIVFAVLNTDNLKSGWLIKIIVIVALVKALQAGMAAQKDRRAAEFGD